MAYKYFCFEGLDGSGKDTQLNLTTKWLRDKSSRGQVLLTSEPWDWTHAGKIIAHKLKNGGFTNPLEALNLYVSDRIEQTLFRRNILRAANIIGSRSDLSTYAYQGMQWVSFDEIREAHDYPSWAILIPDLTFYFQAAIETVLSRVDKRWGEREYFETTERLTKSHEQYLKAIEYLKWERKIIIIDASRSIEKIFEDVVRFMEEEFSA
jgi:dTMP kinase